MDLFKFIPDTVATNLDSQAQAIEGATVVVWTERYRDPGEFEIEAPLASGLREFLPLGTLISHVDTKEVMIVENHQIPESPDDDPVIQITGRSLEAILEDRIVGANNATGSPTGAMAKYELPSAWLSTQIRTLIEEHIYYPTYSDDKLLNVQGDYSQAPQETVEARTIKRGDVLKAVHELLDVKDYGIKVIRPDPGNDITWFAIHNGDDVCDRVIFSWKSGDLDDTEYFWSRRPLKTDALVVGRHIEVRVQGTTSGLDRKIMLVQANDLDEDYDPAGGAPSAALISEFRVRGEAAISGQKTLTITKTDISNTTKFRYRRDFNIGDIVTVDGNYGAIEKMRVMENTEVQDETGESSHPTLSLLEG